MLMWHLSGQVVLQLWSIETYRNSLVSSKISWCIRLWLLPDRHWDYPLSSVWLFFLLSCYYVFCVCWTSHLSSRCRLRVGTWTLRRRILRSGDTCSTETSGCVFLQGLNTKIQTGEIFTNKNINRGRRWSEWADAGFTHPTCLQFTLLPPSHLNPYPSTPTLLASSEEIMTKRPSSYPAHDLTPSVRSRVISQVRAFPQAGGLWDREEIDRWTSGEDLSESEWNISTQTKLMHIFVFKW